MAVAAFVVPLLLNFGPEPVPLLFACAAQDSRLRPCSYKFEDVIHSPELVEGTMDGFAELGLELGLETALAEAE